MNIEKRIELAVKTILESETYINANNIPVYSFRDVSHQRPQNCIVVKCANAENMRGSDGMSSVLWSAPCEVFAISYIPEDKERATLEALYQACLGALHRATKDTYTTAARGGLSFCGVGIESGEEGTEDAVQYLTSKLQVFAQQI